MSYRGNRYVILLFVLLALSAGYIIADSLANAEVQADLNDDHVLPAETALDLEKGVFDRANRVRAYDSLNTTIKGRDLVEYYSNRAFHGAPPTIPHVILSHKGVGGKSCLQCHENGGFVPQFDAYAPVTPHPEFTSCKQCHVPQQTDQLFKPTHWTHPGTPATQQKALPSSPPVIPHNVHLRENCLSCHAGPSAVEAIRVSHPERTNCQQCHAKGSNERSTIGIWDRNDTASTSIIRY